MKTCCTLVLGTILILLVAGVSRGEVQAVTQHNASDTATPEFKFDAVPVPSGNDAATNAKFTILDGRRDRNGGSVDALHDGRMPRSEDQPSENFFFAAGTEGGRLVVDLGAVTEIRKVNTYSWHRDARGPQVYVLFGANGAASGFSLEPKEGADPGTCGWTRVAEVDTRPQEGVGGGQHGVSISDSGGVLGEYRYLLFDISRTEARDPFGNTFYSEIDVNDGKVHESTAPARPEPRLEVVEAGEGAYRIVIDTTETPDLTQWVHEELAPVVKQWYPKIIEMLPSEGYDASHDVTITFSEEMQGVAATGGTNVRCAASWMRRNLEGEAKGAVVHELVHVVQQYGRTRRAGATRTPGWLVEGIADYVRWFLYEPQSRGAEISSRNAARAQYDASYRVSANFLDWVVRTHDKEIVTKLNAAAREGRYREELWKEYTGRTVEELGAEWKAALEK